MKHCETCRCHLREVPLALPASVDDWLRMPFPIRMWEYSERDAYRRGYDEIDWTK